MRSDRLDQLRQMLNEDPTDPFLQYALSLEHIKRKEWHEATDILSSLRKADKNYLALYYQLGRCLEHLGREKDAIATYNEGIEIAREQSDQKTRLELEEAIWELED